MDHFKNLLSIDIQAELKNNNGKLSPKIPREHQEKAHTAMTKFYGHDNKQSGILVLPTGGGKTYTAVFWLIKNILSKNIKVLWLADQGFLLEQARESFKENILEIDNTRRKTINLRIVSGSDRHSNTNQIKESDDVLLITADTAISNWNDTYYTNFKKFIDTNAKNRELFIVYDEAHHTPAFGRRNLLIGGSENRTGILEKYPNTKLLGLTATPTYTNIKQRGWLWEIFKDGIIFEVEKKELEDKKILAIPNYIQERTNFEPILSDADVEKMIIKHQEIPQYIIDDLAKNEERNDFIAQNYYNNKNKYGKTIIFLDRWYQCKMIENYINKKAGREIAASIFSFVDNNKNIEYINNRKNNENDTNLERFRNGKIDVLLNVKMLTEGVDVPDVQTVFITRDTTSNILFTQMVGRALRGEGAGGNKHTANIVFFTDHWNQHIQFAADKLLGGIEEPDTKERGFREFELISIDLIDNLSFEYERKEYTKTTLELIPNGWYATYYSDANQSVDEETGEISERMENYKENISVLEEEKEIFEKFIENFNEKYTNEIWENEVLDIDIAEVLINLFLDENNYEHSKVIIIKLIKIARHMGYNGTKPEYFTFKQKEDVNPLKYVLTIRENNWGLNEAEKYLESEYYCDTNPYLKVIYPDYEVFYQAYQYEDNVYRRKQRGNISIKESSQEILSKRLAPEELRKRVLSRDGFRCLCCGYNKNLQTDHIIAHKYEEPNDGSPDLFQTLCRTCNNDKQTNSYNYRVTHYDENLMSLNELVSVSREEPKRFITRLINCYYKTNAVQKEYVKAINNPRAIWEVKIKHGTNPEENILKIKNSLINHLRSQGFALRDIRISAF